MKYYDYLDNEEENKIKHVLENETKSDALHGIIVLGVDNYVNPSLGKFLGLSKLSPSAACLIFLPGNSVDIISL